MRLPLLISIFVILTGCSSWSWLNGNDEVEFGKPKIHLFLYKGYKDSSAEFVDAFTVAGYEVVLRKGLPPSNEVSSFIIHSPGLNPDHSLEVETVISILKQQGVPVVLQYQYGLGNHSYTPKNIGVYLL